MHAAHAEDAWHAGPYQSCSLTVLSSRYIVFDRKSMPMVACMRACIAYWRTTEVEGKSLQDLGVPDTCYQTCHT